MIDPMTPVCCKNCRHCKSIKIDTYNTHYKCTRGNLIELDRLELKQHKPCYSKKLFSKVQKDGENI